MMKAIAGNSHPGRCLHSAEFIRFRMDGRTDTDAETCLPRKKKISSNKSEAIINLSA